MASEWRRALELGVLSGALTAEGSSEALRQIDALASGSPTIAQVASWARVSPEVVEVLLQLARGLPATTPTVASAVREDSDDMSTMGTAEDHASTAPVERASKREDWPAWVPRRLGSYELEGVLGEGGMGIVFSARHATLGTPCAVKVISPERLSEEAIDRFHDEARSVAGMGKHANPSTRPSLRRGARSGQAQE